MIVSKTFRSAHKQPEYTNASKQQQQKHKKKRKKKAFKIKNQTRTRTSSPFLSSNWQTAHIQRHMLPHASSSSQTASSHRVSTLHALSLILWFLCLPPLLAPLCLSRAVCCG